MHTDIYIIMLIYVHIYAYTHENNWHYLSMSIKVDFICLAAFGLSVVPLLLAFLILIPYFQ